MVKVSDLIKINQVILLKKFKKGFLPTSIEPLFQFKSDAGERLTICHLDQFATILPGRYKTGLFPVNEACRTWNSCPIGIKNLPKISQVKKSLKEYYISKYEVICSNPNCYPCTQN